MPSKILPPPDQTVSLFDKFGMTVGKGGLEQMCIVLGRDCDRFLWADLMR